jgi:repressor LexA
MLVPMSKPDKRVQILRFIGDYTERNGFSPSFREIGEHLGVSSASTVSHHLDFLIRRGWLSQKRGPRQGAPRTLAVTEEGRKLL